MVKNTQDTVARETHTQYSPIHPYNKTSIPLSVNFDNHQSLNGRLYLNFLPAQSYHITEKKMNTANTSYSLTAPVPLPLPLYAEQQFRLSPE